MTEFGKTFQEMKDIEQRKSPLQIKMDELGKKLSIFSFAIIACIMALGIFQGKTFLSMFNIGKLSTYCWFEWCIRIVFVLLTIILSLVLYI
jgi:magnesium-transporting ATPase (P-type)